MCVKSLDELIEHTFPDLTDHTHFANRAILTPKNAGVDTVNNLVMQKFGGDEMVYLSADSVGSADGEAIVYPTEFLNNLCPSGLPPHALRLKVNCPIILLRNLNPVSGLCNGTRLVCRAFAQHVIDAEITSGSHIGQRVFIPRITLTPSDSGLPFDLHRRQFPIKPCFAMTINKSQSQTMEYVGLFLPQHVFTHGQLYVALSRVGGAHCTKLLVESSQIAGRNETFTRNVVYREVL